MKAVLPLTLVATALAAVVFASLASSHSDVVVHLDTAKGLAYVRDSHTGRVMAFQPTAAELGTMKIGDLVKADWKAGTLSELKGVKRTAALVQPDYGEPCCNVVVVAKDKAIANGLLSGLVTDGGKPYDAVAPFHGVIVVKDSKSGKYHVLDTAVLSEKEAPAGSPQLMEMSKLLDEVKVDTPVWVNGKYGMFKQGNALYGFKLRGADNDGGPWVVEPDSKAQGRYGIVRTNWHAKSGSAYQSIKVYLPGKRDADEYHENWKTEHSVMEGEYDVYINGMILEKVPIKAGHATRILMGALHSTAPYAQQLHILDTSDKKVMSIQGGQTIALPIGTYHLKVGTRTINIEVKENEVTEF
jgi:hypothetical protein